MRSTGLTLILVLVFAGVTQSSHHECGSVEIRQFSDFTLLHNCSKVVGHVRIVGLTVSGDEELQLQTAVDEITDYLLVTRVYGLRSLRSIFPNLMLIRGYGADGLLYGEYSLVVYENPDLLNLGLVSLLRIQRGNVLIESNPSLCYVHTVNWVYLLNNITQQHLYINDNQLPNHCSLCDTNPTNIPADDEAAYAEALSIQKHYVYRHCWGFGVVQKPRPNSGNFTKCPNDCGEVGCDAEGKCCSNDCLSGCTATNCSYCASLQEKNACVDQCSANFTEGSCISPEECRTNGRIPYEGQCHENCPLNHRFVNNTCEPECEGTFVIHSRGDLKGLRHCKTLKGSLIIELDEINSTIVMDLNRSLRQLSEITGYLKVTNCHQLVSLNFLQGLDTIRGETLIDGKYAMYVVNNYYLEAVWDRNQHVSILAGSIFFHLNPRLCYEKIMQLESSLKSGNNISISDVSIHSNGERVICGDVELLLGITVEDCNATAARLKMDLLSSENLELLLRYIFFYKEAPVQNLSIYDERHGCGHDDWMMAVSPNRNIRYVIRNLKPDTQYAYFVRMLTKTRYHRRIDGHSEINYFRTRPLQPAAVTKLYYHSRSMHEIILHWWPPSKRNGVIEKYIIEKELLKDKEQNKSLPSDGSYSATNDSCYCNLGDVRSSGPTPNDEHYFSKAQITYEEALPEILYYARPPSNTSAQKANEEDPEDQLRGIEALRKYHAQLEEEARGEQDTGLKDYPIVTPKPLCSPTYQAIDCQKPEKYNGIEVPGNVHSLAIRKLEPGEVYRLMVRACTASVTNGCGPGRYIYVQTVSKKEQRIFKRLEGIY